jgi:hypothetical protein
MARKTDTSITEAEPTDLATIDQEAIDVEAMYRVELARPIRLSGIALHPNDPDVIVSGAILEKIRAAVTTFTRL